MNEIFLKKFLNKLIHGLFDKFEIGAQSAAIEHFLSEFTDDDRCGGCHRRCVTVGTLNFRK
jgi:hypothetical protein